MTTVQADLRAQLAEQGYAVVPSGLPPANLEAVIADIWRHTGPMPCSPRPPGGREGGSDEPRAARQ